MIECSSVQRMPWPKKKETFTQIFWLTHAWKLDLKICVRSNSCALFTWFYYWKTILPIKKISWNVVKLKLDFGSSMATNLVTSLHILSFDWSYGFVSFVWVCNEKGLWKQLVLITQGVQNGQKTLLIWIHTYRRFIYWHFVHRLSHWQNRFCQWFLGLFLTCGMEYVHFFVICYRFVK